MGTSEKKIEVIISTQNSQKVSRTREVFQTLNPGIEVLIQTSTTASGVSETPWDEETLVGAMNRIKSIQDFSTSYLVALESGLTARHGKVFEEALCVISYKGEAHIGVSSLIEVPQSVTDLMRTKEMPHYKVMPFIRNKLGITENNSDTWGTYSGELIKREVSFSEAVRNAAIPFFAKDKSLYKIGAILSE